MCRVFQAAFVVVLSFFIFSTVSINCVEASDLNRKLQKMVEKIAHAIKEQSPDLSESTIAVFPANADEKLVNKRVDFAVSELLKQQLLSQTKFHLVERSSLDKILSEQKLGLSGAIDSETAVTIGKLLGSRLSLMSSVARFGKSYQITAKIVDNETAQVLALGADEIPIETFDEDAHRYLALVPERQIIGIFGTFGGPLISGSAFKQTIQASPAQEFDTAGTEAKQYAGAGIRYFPHKRLFVDAIIYPTVSRRGSFSIFYPSQVVNEYLTTESFTAEHVYNLSQGLSWHASINNMFTLSKTTDLTIGLGMIRVPLKLEMPLMNGTNVEETIDFNTITAGFEWRPQDRLGLAVTAMYLMGDMRALRMIYWLGDGTRGDIDVFRPQYNSLALNYTVTLYF